MMRQLIDTISAIATPLGDGGIGIVRLSGPEALVLADKVFRRSGGKNLLPVQSHRVIFGAIHEGEKGKKVDEVLLTVMKGPRSFTGEDVVEINCHGGLFVTRRVLEETLKAGARLAEPGEFTRRAFLNGRLNLIQAEGIIDLIHSRSELSHDAAITELDGGLMEEMGAMRESLLKVAQEVESQIDFSEEELDTGNGGQWLQSIDKVRARLRHLLRTYDHGKIVREGLHIAIAGRPNVGKSSLMNALLKEERAIVSSQPGTTRDTIEEKLSVNGVVLQLIDTAGVQEAKDFVEKEGIRRSHQKMEGADVVLLLFDGSQPLKNEDLFLIEKMKSMDKKLVAIMNKIDKPAGKAVEQLNSHFDDGSIYSVSAKERLGLEELLEGLASLVWQGAEKITDNIVITRKRHYDLLLKTLDSLDRGRTALIQEQGVELLAEDLREGVMAIGEMTGESYSEEVLERIFRDFCIGK